MTFIYETEFARQRFVKTPMSNFTRIKQTQKVENFGFTKGK